MLNKKSVVACFFLLVPFLLGRNPGGRADPGARRRIRNAAETAKRSKCFEEANAAAARVNSSAGPGQAAERKRLVPMPITSAPGEKAFDRKPGLNFFRAEGRHLPLFWTQSGHA